MGSAPNNCVGGARGRGARCQPIRTRHANKQAGICLAATPKHSVAALSKFLSLWLTPSETWTLVRGWALGQGRIPGCPKSGMGEGQKWSETGPRPRRLWTQMVRRHPGDSEQRKGQACEGHRLWGTKDL